jgi:hypothetical protein
MTKWREERIYEIMTEVNKNSKFRDLYETELKKSQDRYPKSEFFIRIEMCYEKAKQKYENLQR